MAQIVGREGVVGDAIVDYEDKVFPDHQAEPGQKAFVFYHCVPFESSASLVNLLTATRILPQGVRHAASSSSAPDRWSPPTTRGLSRRSATRASPAT